MHTAPPWTQEKLPSPQGYRFGPFHQAAQPLFHQYLDSVSYHLWRIVSENVFRGQICNLVEPNVSFFVTRPGGISFPTSDLTDFCCCSPPKQTTIKPAVCILVFGGVAAGFSGFWSYDGVIILKFTQPFQTMQSKFALEIRPSQKGIPLQTIDVQGPC